MPSTKLKLNAVGKRVVNAQRTRCTIGDDHTCKEFSKWSRSARLRAKNNTHALGLLQFSPFGKSKSTLIPSSHQQLKDRDHHGRDYGISHSRSPYCDHSEGGERSTDFHWR